MTTTVLVQTATLLGKRKLDHFTYNIDSSSSSKIGLSPPDLINGQLKNRPKKRFHCTFEGCDKAYSKPSRLQEHQRSHTGEVCAQWHSRASFMLIYIGTKSGHLFARIVEILIFEIVIWQPTPEPISQSLQKHLYAQKSSVARSFGPLNIFAFISNGMIGRNLLALGILFFGPTYLADFSQCSHSECKEVFAKHHQLRAHECETHLPLGTKPYPCSHPSCNKSFSTNQKLTAHMKAHDGEVLLCWKLTILTTCD
jgi:general transcription factor IIIA